LREASLRPGLHCHVLVGRDERSFIGGFRGLQAIGYHDFRSFQCGVDGDRQAGIPKSVAFLEDQWDRAKA